jgi:hypothetical protein
MLPPDHEEELQLVITLLCALSALVLVALMCGVSP